MRLSIGILTMFLVLAEFGEAQINRNSGNAVTLSSPPEGASESYGVFGATSSQEAALRAKIRLMHPEVLPLRVLFVPHWKYLDNTRIFRLKVPSGFGSLMFTHLPSRTVFIDSDRYQGEEWLGYWIAHELGHLATNSAKEEDAKRVARKFRKRLQVGVVLAHDKADASQQQFWQSVPFELHAGFLISIKGRIGQLNGLRFILDTGTTVSVVDRRVAMKFPISLRSDRLFAFQKFVVLDRAEFPEVQFGPVKAENVSLLVADLAKTSEFAAHADAVIGLDLLCLSKTLRIDYNTATVSFIGSETAPSAVDMRQHPKCLTAELIVQGHPVRLIVDTGMEGVLFYENRLRKRVPDLRLQGKPQNGHLGWMRAKSTMLPGLQLNNTVSEIPIWLADGPKENVLPGIDGILGTASLKARQIEFDFEKNVLRWQ